MPRWTAAQDEVLMLHGHEGAERCAAIMRHRFGVRRTPDAVKRHAYRIGAPMVRYEICVTCGGKTDSADADGNCPICHVKALTERRRAETERIRDEIRRSGKSSEGYEAANREYARARQEGSRLRRSM